VTDVFVLTVTYNVYLTRPVREGVMTATGHVVNRSKNLFIAQAEIVDGRGRSVGRGSGSFMRSAIPLSPAVGYA
jgi:acyl-coenzyme A thioesterase PaaI-like protein